MPLDSDAEKAVETLAWRRIRYALSATFAYVISGPSIRCSPKVCPLFYIEWSRLNRRTGTVAEPTDTTLEADPECTHGDINNS